MLSSINPVGERARNQRWGVTATFYVLGSLAGGGLAGGALGAVGALALGWTATSARLVALAALAAAGLAVDLGRLPGSLPTWRRQVDERWLSIYRGWVYGVGFGFQLGLGVVTIVPASITYVVLGAAALTADAAHGAVIGLVFGAARAAPLLVTRRADTPAALRRLHRRVLDAAPPVRRLALAAQSAVAVLSLVAALTVRFP